jgi:hypothetical protein
MAICPDRSFLSFEGKTQTFTQTNDRINCLAQALRQMGMHEGGLYYEDLLSSFPSDEISSDIEDSDLTLLCLCTLLGQQGNLKECH